MIQTDMLLKYLRDRRWPLNTEAELQTALWQPLRSFSFDREYRLDPKNRIDFFRTSDGTGIEVKIKGQQVEILKQCTRYCTFDPLKRLILITNRTLGFPAEIGGKPVYVIQLGRGWL